MADPPTPGLSTIPSGIARSQPTKPDQFHPTPPDSRDEPSEAGPSNYDYTENAPQAVVDAIAIERAREQKEGPPEMMVGSFSSWAGAMDDPGIFPTSSTRAPIRAGSRRASIASRTSGSFIRPTGLYSRQSGSQQDVLQSPTSGVFAADSEDESPTEYQLPARMNSFQANGAMSSPKVGRRKDSRRRSRAQSTQDGYFAPRDIYPGRGRTSIDQDQEEGGGVSVSPARPSTTLARIASYMGFRSEVDEESGLRRSSMSRSRASMDTRPSRSPSRSSSGWGLSDEDEEMSDQGEGYSSSLADDTSLPPQSRPTSPSLPLVPATGDGIFGEPSRNEEPKDFASVSVPSRQTILLPDEDLSIRFTCYRTDPLRNSFWWLGCILSIGGLGLLGRWVPSVWVRFCGKETAFDEAKEGSWLVVEVGQTRD